MRLNYVEYRSLSFNSCTSPSLRPSIMHFERFKNTIWITRQSVYIIKCISNFYEIVVKKWSYRQQLNLQPYQSTPVTSASHKNAKTLAVHNLWDKPSYCLEDTPTGVIVSTAPKFGDNCSEDVLKGHIVSTAPGMRKLVAIAALGMRKLVAIAAQGGLRHLFLLLLTLLSKAIVLCIAILSTVTAVES
jgi:hypothetical protein